MNRALYLGSLGLPLEINQAPHGLDAPALVSEPILPSRKSSPVSCIARKSAGQSSKLVAWIFST